MKKGMLLVFWGLMLLTLTIIELPVEQGVWIMNIAGYGLCAAGMIYSCRKLNSRTFLHSGLALVGAAICCILTLSAGLPLRYNGVIQLVCRMLEMLGFAKMFEGCWRRFRQLHDRQKAKESDLRMKMYILGFTVCALIEGAAWFTGSLWGTLASQLLIRLVYGALMACVMLYSEDPEVTLPE